MGNRFNYRQGSQRSIVTIVERTTTFFLMKKLPNGKNAEALARIVNQMLLPYKDVIFSITIDNGTEFAQHKKISKKLLTEFFLPTLIVLGKEG